MSWSLSPEMSGAFSESILGQIGYRSATDYQRQYDYFDRFGWSGILIDPDGDNARKRGGNTLLPDEYPVLWSIELSKRENLGFLRDEMCREFVVADQNRLRNAGFFNTDVLLVQNELIEIDGWHPEKTEKKKHLMGMVQRLYDFSEGNIGERISMIGIGKVNTLWAIRCWPVRSWSDFHEAWVIASFGKQDAYNMERSYGERVAIDEDRVRILFQYNVPLTDCSIQAKLVWEQEFNGWQKTQFPSWEQLDQEYISLL